MQLADLEMARIADIPVPIVDERSDQMGHLVRAFETLRVRPHIAQDAVQFDALLLQEDRVLKIQDVGDRQLLIREQRAAIERRPRVPSLSRLKSMNT